MAPLRYAAKFDPFLSLDKERKGSKFANWQPWAADGFGSDGPFILMNRLRAGWRWCHFALLTLLAPPPPVNGPSSNCFLPPSNRCFSNLRNLKERTNYLEASEFAFHSEQMAREGEGQGRGRNGSELSSTENVLCER